MVTVEAVTFFFIISFFLKFTSDSFDFLCNIKELCSHYYDSPAPLQLWRWVRKIELHYLASAIVQTDSTLTVETVNNNNNKKGGWEGVVVVVVFRGRAKQKLNTQKSDKNFSLSFLCTPLSFLFLSSTNNNYKNADISVQFLHSSNCITLLLQH